MQAGLGLPSLRNTQTPSGLESAGVSLWCHQGCHQSHVGHSEKGEAEGGCPSLLTVTFPFLVLNFKLWLIVCRGFSVGMVFCQWLICIYIRLPFYRAAGLNSDLTEREIEQGVTENMELLT